MADTLNRLLIGGAVYVSLVLILGVAGAAALKWWLRKKGHI